MFEALGLWPGMPHLSSASVEKTEFVRQRSSTTNESAAEQDRKCEMDSGAKQQKHLEMHQIGQNFDIQPPGAKNKTECTNPNAETEATWKLQHSYSSYSTLSYSSYPTLSYSSYSSLSYFQLL